MRYETLNWCATCLVVLIPVQSSAAEVEASTSPAPLASIAKGGPPDRQIEAIGRLMEMEAHGNIAARYQLGRCFENGWGVVGDTETAKSHFRSAAEENCEDAAFRLARLCFAGVGTKRDVAEGIHWLRWLADRGNADAQYFLARSHEYGLLTDADKLAPDVDVQNRQAFELSLLMNEPDYVERFRLNIDLFPRHSDCLGDMSLPSRADHWYELAAKQGHLLACVSLGLARTYDLRSDPTKWVVSPYLDVAADRGGPVIESWVGSFLAAYSPPNVKMINEAAGRYISHARPGLEKLANAGNPMAEEMLAELYRFGRGGIQNDEKLADQWQQRADKKYFDKADHGDVVEQYLFGISGEDLSWRSMRRDDERARRRAFYWFARAAQSGFPPAQFQLGCYLANGWGLKEDKRQANYWLRLAKQHGFGQDGKNSGKNRVREEQGHP